MPGLIALEELPEVHYIGVMAEKSIVVRSRAHPDVQAVLRIVVRAPQEDGVIPGFLVGDLARDLLRRQTREFGLEVLGV